MATKRIISAGISSHKNMGGYSARTNFAYFCFGEVELSVIEPIDITTAKRTISASNTTTKKIIVT